MGFQRFARCAFWFKFTCTTSVVNTLLFLWLCLFILVLSVRTFSVLFMFSYGDSFFVYKVSLFCVQHMWCHGPSQRSRCRGVIHGVAKPSKRDGRGASVCRSSNGVRPSRSPGQALVCQPMLDFIAAPVHAEALSGKRLAVSSNPSSHTDLDLALQQPVRAGVVLSPAFHQDVIRATAQFVVLGSYLEAMGRHPNVSNFLAFLKPGDRHHASYVENLRVFREVTGQGPLSSLCHGLVQPQSDLMHSLMNVSAGFGASARPVSQQGLSDCAWTPPPPPLPGVWRPPPPPPPAPASFVHLVARH